MIRHASRDPRLAGHPGVARYGIESYIAVPLRLRDGRCFGTLCALDPRPIEIDEAHVANFELLADLLAFEIEADAARATERERVESALGEAEQRLRLAVGAAGMAVWDWNLETDEVVWTAPMPEQAGAAPGERRGGFGSFLRLVHSEDAARVEAQLRSAIAAGGDLDIEFRVVSRSGAVRWSHSRGRVIYDRSGRAVRMLGVAVDVTETRRARDERALLVERERAALADARAALRTREEFLAIAAHELKTPVVALSLHYEAMRRALARDPRAVDVGRRRLREELEEAGRQVIDLLRLVDRLLDASRVAAGRLDLRRERFDLAAVVRDVAADLGAEARASGSTISVSAPAAVEGTWDRTRIGQVVTNLLSNAVKYGRGRPIEVEVAARGGAAVVAVRDQGIGIAPGARERIFERFERSASRDYGGFGLGLFIAREIVRAHGGDIGVESEPGKGSTFCIELPRA